jgi:hypothetical protein
MKIFISNTTKNKIEEMFKNEKGGNIQIRKYNVKKDPISNAISGIKLSDAHRVKHKGGMFYKYYLTKDKIKDIKKQMEAGDNASGGILPLVALLPLIFGGLAAAGGATAGIATAVKASSDVKANNAKIEEDKRFHDELLAGQSQKQGSCLECPEGKKVPKVAQAVYSDFVKALNLDKENRRAFKNILQMIQAFTKMERHGEALYLFPPS